MLEYEALTRDEQIAGYRNRIKEIEGSQFVLRMELNELVALARIVHPDEADQLRRDAENKTQQIVYGDVRLQATRDALEALKKEASSEVDLSES